MTNSQSPNEAGYRVLYTDGESLIVEDMETGQRELWVESPNYAGFTLIHEGKEYEFVTNIGIF